MTGIIIAQAAFADQPRFPWYNLGPDSTNSENCKNAAKTQINMNIDNNLCLFSFQIVLLNNTKGANSSVRLYR